MEVAEPRPDRRQTQALHILAATITGVFVVRWLLVQEYDFDTVLTLLVPLKHGASARVLSHAPLLPVILTPLAHLTTPLFALWLVGAAAVYGTVFLLGRCIYSVWGNPFAGAAAVLVAVGSLGFRQIAMGIDDNLFPLPFVLGASFVASKQLTARRTWVCGCLIGIAASFHLTCVLASIPLAFRICCSHADEQKSKLLRCSLFAVALLVTVAALCAGSYVLASFSDHFSFRPFWVSRGYFNNGEWFLLSQTRSLPEFGSWLLGALGAITQHVSPVPGRYSILRVGSEALGPMGVLTVGLSLVWAALQVGLAAVSARNWLASRLKKREDAIVPISLQQFAIFFLFAAVYEPENPERLVTGFPFLVVASAIGLRGLVARHVDGPNAGKWRQRFSLLAVALGASALPILVLGGALVAQGRPSIADLATNVPEKALLIVDEQISSMIAYHRPGWSAVVQKDGSDDYGCIVAEEGKVMGYDPLDECTFEGMHEKVCRSLANGAKVIVVAAGKDSPAANSLSACGPVWPVGKKESLPNGWRVYGVELRQAEQNVQLTE